jgi:hypothetical protein
MRARKKNDRFTHAGTFLFAGYKKNTSPSATMSPTTSAPTNEGTDEGAMPANELENIRPTAIAGLAKLVELVKK